MSEGQNCGNCRFRSPDLRLEFAGSGHCRRYPPRILMVALMDGGRDFETLWPWMSKDDWCGEHSPNKETQNDQHD